MDLTRRCVRWRRENDKIGFEHETPLTAEALQTLKAVRRSRPALGEAWIFPSSGPSGGPVSRHRFRDWSERIEARAKLSGVERLGWHALRRKFATELKEMPLKDLSATSGAGRTRRRS